MNLYRWKIRFDNGTEEEGTLHSSSKERVEAFITLNCPDDAVLVGVEEVI